MTDKPKTDIVERLRGHDWDGSGFSESLAEEAADEIERLGEQVAHWKAIAQAHNDSLVARIEEQGGEVMVDGDSTPWPHKSNDPETWSHWSLAEEVKSLRAQVERLGINEMDCKTLRAENELWKQRALTADEITAKFRAENERWNDLAQHNREAADHLEAENERLREALEKSVTLDPEKPSRWLTRSELDAIARRVFVLKNPR
jgi:hypothetical protein